MAARAKGGKRPSSADCGVLRPPSVLEAPHREPKSQLSHPIKARSQSRYSCQQTVPPFDVGGSCPGSATLFTPGEQKQPRLRKVVPVPSGYFQKRSPPRAIIGPARECFAAAYSERLALLTAMRAPPEGKVADITCSPMPWEGGARADHNRVDHAVRSQRVDTRVNSP